MHSRGRWGFRRSVLLTALLSLGSAAGMHVGAAKTSVAGYPVTQARCGGVSAAVSVFRPRGIPERDWREELVFDRHGGMWVSPINSSFVERYSPSGVVTERVAVPGPGGLALGPDGLVYSNFANGPGAPGIVRFDPALARPVATRFASGLPGANALAFDGAGVLYESTEGPAPSVLRIRPDGTRDTAWDQAAAFYGANGVAVSGGNLFGAVSFDQRSPIELVPIANPAAHRTFTVLSFGALSRQPAIYQPDPHQPLLPKGLDDLTIGPDGRIYVVGFVSGELLRVDPTTGQACVLVSGLVTPTAVQFAVDFGGFDPRRDLFVTEATGGIFHVHLRP